MKITRGKWISYGENIEQTAIEQFADAMAQPFAVKGALMADAHTGYSLPIGGVVATDNVVVPAWVGYDIGCGMAAIRLPLKTNQLRGLESLILAQIYRDVPTGFNHNKEETYWAEYNPEVEATKTLIDIFTRDKNGRRDGLCQLGTLGGGNHFIEIAYDTDNRVWIVVHSGSRGIGHAVATHYMRLASGDGKAREGHFGFRADSSEGKDYITDMNFCLEYALANRKEIIRRVWLAITHVLRSNRVEADINGTLPDMAQLINRNHNHAELKDGLLIHRKGATHAEEGMMGVIPGNMRDGSFIVRGKGNPDSLNSCSHGAGRVLGRKKAKEMLGMDEFRKSMEGITASVVRSVIDESPMAYKNIFDVMAAQTGLVDVCEYLMPLINVKDTLGKR